MAAMADAAASELRNGWGFCIIAAPFGELLESGGEFVSNIRRKECISLIRDTADRLERNSS